MCLWDSDLWVARLGASRRGGSDGHHQVVKRVWEGLNLVWLAGVDDGDYLASRAQQRREEMGRDDIVLLSFGSQEEPWLAPYVVLPPRRPLPFPLLWARSFGMHNPSMGE